MLSVFVFSCRCEESAQASREACGSRQEEAAGWARSLRSSRASRREFSAPLYSFTSTPCVVFGLISEKVRGFSFLFYVFLLKPQLSLEQ